MEQPLIYLESWSHTMLESSVSWGSTLLLNFYALAFCVS